MAEIFNTKSSGKKINNTCRPFFFSSFVMVLVAYLGSTGFCHPRPMYKCSVFFSSSFSRKRSVFGTYMYKQVCSVFFFFFYSERSVFGRDVIKLSNRGNIRKNAVHLSLYRSTRQKEKESGESRNHCEKKTTQKPKSDAWGWVTCGAFFRSEWRAVTRESVDPLPVLVLYLAVSIFLLETQKVALCTNPDWSCERRCAKRQNLIIIELSSFVR